MWPFGAVGSTLQHHDDSDIPITMHALTLRFCDWRIEEGFVKDRMADLKAKFRLSCVLVGLMVIASIVFGNLWDQNRLQTAEQKHTLMFIGLACVAGLIALVLMIAMTFLPDRVFGSYLVLEVIVVVCSILGLVGHTCALPWYAARLQGIDPSAFGTSDFGQMTDTRMVLVIDVCVSCTHFALPVRFYVLVIVEVVSILCYIVPTWALGGPEPASAPQTLIFLMALVAMAAYGKRSLECQERTHFLSLIREKSLRFQSEFELSQHVPQLGRRGCSSEEESRPSTTETASAFVLGERGVQELVPIGQKEQWLIVAEEMLFNFSMPHIGEGGYSKVYSGLYHGHPVAIKVPKVRSHEVTIRSQVTQLCNELRILRKLRHPNIVFFYGACIGEQQPQVALVLELVTGCSLRHFILCEHPYGQHSPAGGTQEPPAEVERAHVIVGSSSALRYLHTRTPRVVHGDLKCSNVFVERTCCSRRLPAAKLLDFGLSRALTRNAKPLGGTLRWVAPEVLSGSSPDTPADVFSFGCLAFFIAMGRYTSNGGRPSHLLGRPAGGWLALACGPLVQECCSADATRRPRMQQVHRQATGWLEALLPRGEPRAGPPAGADAPGPLDGAAVAMKAAPWASCQPAGTGGAAQERQELELLAPEYRRTPAATVDGMVCDLMLSCNLEVPSRACCPFHAALSGLSRTIAGRLEGPCKRWSPGDTACRQCDGCGRLVCRGSDGDDIVACNFCGHVFSETWRPDSMSSNSLPVIRESSASDDEEKETPCSQASDETSCGLAL